MNNITTDNRPSYDPEPKLCRYCGKEILFIRDHGASKFRPVDPKAIKVVTSDGKVIRAWIPHWEACPGPNSAI